MTRLFSAGAEAGSMGVFDTIGAVASVSAVQKRTGAYSFLQNATSIGPAAGLLGTVIFAADKTALYFRIGLYLTGVYASANNYAPVIQLRDNAGDYQCALSIDKMTYLLHVMRRWGSQSGTDLGVTANPVPLNQWCCIEWYIKIADGTDGESIVKIDGTTEFSDLDLDTKYTAVAGARSVGYSERDIGLTTCGVRGYYDDLAINDTVGAVNNSWIGRGGIYGIVPEGVGTYTDLHAQGHANAWDCISEVPPDDADYVYDDTVDQKSTYALTALTPTTGTIDCINVIMRAKLDAAGTGNIARLLRSNGTDSQGADVGLDVSAKTIQEIIETDPSGGAAFTVARVNALEAGAVVR